MDTKVLALKICIRQLSYYFHPGTEISFSSVMQEGLSPNAMQTKIDLNVAGLDIAKLSAEDFKLLLKVCDARTLIQLECCLLEAFNHCWVYIKGTDPMKLTPKMLKPVAQRFKQVYSISGDNLVDAMVLALPVINLEDYDNMLPVDVFEHYREVCRRSDSAVDYARAVVVEHSSATAAAYFVKWRVSAKPVHAKHLSTEQVKRFMEKLLNFTTPEDSLTAELDSWRTLSMEAIKHRLKFICRCMPGGAECYEDFVKTVYILRQD